MKMQNKRKMQKKKKLNQNGSCKCPFLWALNNKTWRSPTPKAPYFTALLCWLLGFPALHQPTIKWPLTMCLIEPLACLNMPPKCNKKCLYDQWLLLRWLVALLFDFVGLSRTWRNIDSEGDCYLWIKTSRMTRYENVQIVQLDGDPLAICTVRHPSQSLPIFYLIWASICF